MTKKTPAIIKPKRYYYGMTLQYLGETYTVTSVKKGGTSIDLEQHLIYIHEKNQSSEAIKNQVLKLYRQQFIELLTDEIAIYQPFYHVKINTIRIKKMKSR